MNKGIDMSGWSRDQKIAFRDQLAKALGEPEPVMADNELVSVANELNNSIKGLSPKIKEINRKASELAQDIEKVVTDIVEPADKFSAKASKVIKDLGGPQVRVIPQG